MSNTVGRRAHIYTRVSSEGQEDNYSLDGQVSACRTYAEQQGWMVASVAREVWSGADMHRPELDALMNRIQAGDVVLALNLDRFSRLGPDGTAVLMYRIASLGASVDFVTESFEESDMGDVMRSLRAWGAADERKRIIKRTQDGRRARVATGKPISGPSAPFGYRWNADKSAFLIEPESAAVVRLIFDLALEGLSLRAIGRELEARGIATPSGKLHWSPTGLRHILTRPVYSGTHVAYRHRHERQPNGRYIERPSREDERVLLPGIAEAIISEEEHAAVLNLLERNKANSTRRNKAPEMTLLRAGFVKCRYCGWTMNVKHSPESRSPQPRYVCNRRECPKPTIAASILDPLVWESVGEIVHTPQIIAEAMFKHRQDGGLERDLATVEKRLQGVVNEQQRLARNLAMIEDAAAAEPVIALLTDLSARKSAIEQERDSLRERMADAEADKNRVQSFTEVCERVRANFDALTYTERRWAIDALGVQVFIAHPDATDEAGNRVPRWAVTLDPAPLTDQTAILYHSTR